MGTRIEHLDLGGGLGVSYDGSRVPTAQEYANAVLPIVRESGLAIVLEPGRQIVAPAGALLTRVVDVKAAGRELEAEAVRHHGRRHDRADPADALQRLPPHRAGRADRGGRPRCATSSARSARAATRSARTATLPRPQVGELYAVLDTGAYGSVMASNYNRRLLPAEVMVEDGTAKLIRRRQTIDELLSLEI